MPYPFPVYPDLEHYLGAAGPEADPKIARVMATCSGYSYSDITTLQTVIGRLGLEGNRCVEIAETVDAMFVCSTAFVIQSAGNEVVIVCYRGTVPTSLISWLGDLTVEPTRVQVPASGGEFDLDFYVHGGFYRDVRATRFRVDEVLKAALDGRPVDHPNAAPVGPPPRAVYVTGHSLGGAMAAIMAALMQTDDDLEHLSEVLQAVYTFGQPMVASAALAMRWGQLRVAPHRYVYENDVVPALPPRFCGGFEHFGDEHRFEGGSWGPGNTEQMSAAGLLELPVEMILRASARLSKYRLPRSLHDHGPQYYVEALTDRNAYTELGDKNFAAGRPRR